MSTNVFPTRMDFLETDWVANPMFLLKQVVSYGLVISIWRHSVGYQGIEPRYLRVHFYPDNNTYL